MQIVIDIPEDTYIATCNESMLPPDVKNVVNAIKNGTPLPKGHGRLIDADEYKRNLKWNENIDNAPTIIEADKESENG